MDQTIAFLLLSWLELSVVMTPDLPLWYHSPFTLSLALQLRLTWILGRRAVQCPIQTC